MDCSRIFKIPAKCYTGKGCLGEQISKVDDTHLLYKDFDKGTCITQMVSKACVFVSFKAHRINYLSEIYIKWCVHKQKDT